MQKKVELDKPGKAMNAMTGTSVKDPVCGMAVDPNKTSHRHTYQGRSYYFCSAGCQGKFVAQPAKYLAEQPGRVEKGAFGKADASAVGGEVSGDGSGFAGGGQVGCDYQFSGGFVIGARNMFDWSSNSKSGTFPVTAFGGLPATVDFKNQWFDTLTARIGYAVQPNWLLYFQGGGAWAHTTTSVTVASGGALFGGQTSNTRTGWTIGGGVEWMFAPHWSAFLEGNYMDFGSKSGTVVTAAGTCALGCSFSAKATEATALVGVNYRFF